MLRDQPGAGMKVALEQEWFVMDESGTFVRLNRPELSCFFDQGFTRLKINR
jgi:hypothetical protein